jgi:hypothetical protein
MKTKLLTICLLLFTLQVFASGITVKTNIKDIVFKKMYCECNNKVHGLGNNCLWLGHVVNKGKMEWIGVIKIKSFNEDGDQVGFSKSYTIISAKKATTFFERQRSNCDYASTLKIEMDTEKYYLDPIAGEW